MPFNDALLKQMSIRSDRWSELGANTFSRHYP